MLRVSHFLRLFSIGLALSALTLTSFVSAQLPVDVPREDLFIFDQIFRRSPTGNYNGWINGNSDAHRNALSFDTLWYFDVETAQERNGLAAEGPIYNDDFTTLTVKLRDNIYWTDGELFDADDYVFTLETLKATEGMRFHSDLNLFVKSIEKVDQFTFNLHLNESNSRMHYTFLAVWHGIYPMPEHIVRGQDPITWQNNDPHVTTAAYNQTEADPNGFWELFERRDDWERSVAGLLEGNPGPKYILSILYGTSDRKAIAMARDELDVFFNVDFEAFEAVTDASDASSSWFKDFPWAYPNEANFRVLTFNLDDPKFQDKRVRWALTLALDIVELHTEYIGGVTRITALPMPATATLMELYHNPMEEWLQNFEFEIEPGVMYQPYDTTVRSRVAAWADGKGYALPEDHRDFFGTHWWKFDTDAATTLLEQAGFSQAKNGSWLMPNGEKFTIELIAPPDEPDSFRTATAAADMWAAFGIDTSLQGLDRNLWSNLCNQGDYDVCSNWRSYTNPAGDVWGGIRTLHTDFYVPSGELQITGNLGRIQSAEIDRIATEMAALLPADPANLALGVEFQQEWIENMYGIPVVSFKKFVTFNETYWTNVPSFENAIGQPLYWFAGGKFTFQNLQKVGE